MEFLGWIHREPWFPFFTEPYPKSGNYLWCQNDICWVLWSSEMKNFHFLAKMNQNITAEGMVSLLFWLSGGFSICDFGCALYLCWWRAVRRFSSSAFRLRVFDMWKYMQDLLKHFSSLTLFLQSGGWWYLHSLLNLHLPDDSQFQHPGGWRNLQIS